MPLMQFVQMPVFQNESTEGERTFLLPLSLLDFCKRYIWWDFQVVNVGRNGHKLEITSRIRDPNNDIADFQNRKTEGKRIGYKIEAEGDHQICFDNRYYNIHLPLWTNISHFLVAVSEEHRNRPLAVFLRLWNCEKCLFIQATVARKIYRVALSRF